MNFHEYLSLREVARVTKLGYYTARRRVIKRRIKVRRKGRMIFIRRSDIVLIREA